MDSDFDRRQRETARELGYGLDAAALNRDHDVLHADLCRAFGIRSHALRDARGEPLTPQERELAAYEESAVIATQRLIQFHRRYSMLTIAAMNPSTVLTDDQVKTMLPALETQLNRDLAPSWGTREVAISFFAKGEKPPVGSWWLVFLDDSDQAGALAYHDLTDEGLPISKVFVKTLVADKASVSVGASHELCEMMCDPWLNGAYEDAHGAFWAAECADPFEDDQYGYKIGEVLVTDFALPSWFGYAHESGPVDFMKHSTKPFEILSGGYAQKRAGHGGWQQITGEQARLSGRANPSRGSRRDRRERGCKEWQRSAPDFDG